MTRPILIALLVVIAVFGVGLMLRNMLFTDQSPEPTAASAPVEAPRPTQLTVRRVEGHVERRASEGEQWQPLAPNASVSEQDSVRTDDGAKAVLAGEGGLEIELAEQSQLAMLALKPDEAKVVVERGRVAATTGKGAAGKAATKLSVGARDTDAWVEAKQGAFAVLRDGDGKLAVAVTEGDVAVTAQNTRVQVGAGEQSIVQPNQAPAKPTRIPTSLFLKVARGGPSRLAQRTTEVSGLTTPGAAVFVNGTPVTTDPSGKFVAKVPLQEGRNQLQVSVRDVLGRREQQQLADVTVDTQPPKLKGKTVW
jgi:hypothetical protein